MTILNSFYNTQSKKCGVTEIPQSCISPVRRYHIIGWMGKLCRHFSLPRTVFPHSVAIFDCFTESLSGKRMLDTQNIHLYALTSICLSSKYASARTAALRDMLRECGLAPAALANLEADVLEATGFRASLPCAWDVLEIICGLLPSDRHLRILTATVCEVLLQFSSFLRYAPSTLAISVLAFSSLCLSHALPRELAAFARRRESLSALFACAEEAHAVMRDIQLQKRRTFLQDADRSALVRATALLGANSAPDAAAFLCLFGQHCS